MAKMSSLIERGSDNGEWRWLLGWIGFAMTHHAMKRHLEWRIHTSADNSVLCTDLCCLIGLNNLWFLAPCALRPNHLFFVFFTTYEFMWDTRAPIMLLPFSNAIYLSAQHTPKCKYSTIRIRVFYIVTVRLTSGVRFLCRYTIIHMRYEQQHDVINTRKKQQNLLSET